MTILVIVAIKAAEKPQERLEAVRVKNDLPRAMRALLTVQLIFRWI